MFKRPEAPEDLAVHRTVAGTPLSDVLVEAGLVGSRREAIRQIETQSSVRVDGEKWTTDGPLPGPEHVVQVGKRRWARVVVDADNAV